MADDLTTPEPAPPRAPATRWGVVALVIVAVLTVLGGATALILPRLDSAPVPSASPKYVGCMQFGTDKDYCDRFIDDVVRRSDLSQEQRDVLEPDAKRAREAASSPALCGDPDRGVVNRQFAQCMSLPSTGSGRGGARIPTPADAEAIRLALERAGFPGAVVRVARDDDPAPHGTILFGVPIGTACLLGYQSAGSGGGGYSLQGHLPDGSCVRD
ncbi:hypothetical protein [Dactylosporangium sp. CS-033363]|uniref:hypothetical protein n=1 Tax=Dactylosporangium sp. CS-033363 TaxID=3239935 RepID=UPI003D8F369A